jgi:hypothetical protein
MRRATSNLVIAGYIGIALRHALLHLDRAAHRLDHAGELDQDAVAGGLDHASSVLCDFRVDQLPAMRLELGKGPRLVHTHQSAVARDIGGQDSSQLAFDALHRHRETSLPKV